MIVDSVLLHDHARSSWATPSQPRPIAATIWTPDDWLCGADGPMPLVVLSHGTGGAASDLVWLAGALSDAGFLVAAVDHHGNSWKDEYLAEGFAFTWQRPRDLSILIDHMIANFPVDPGRIGAAGFSLGGYTVTALLGARQNPAVLEALLRRQIPEPPLPEFPNLVAAIHAKYSWPELATILPSSALSQEDDRVRAGFALAPAIGQLVDTESLHGITRPFELRWGDADDNMVPAENALRYLTEISTASGCSVGESIGHYVFLGDADDPSGVRESVAIDAVAFFTTNLAPELA